jgi:site-specific DNA-methyltransferase (adenine-specific)
VSVRILIGDCAQRMRDLPDNRVDSVVCDPPYHLTSIVKRFGAENAAPAKVGKTGAYARASKGFMGQTWDGGDVAFRPETWAEALRVLKPGGHLVAFSGTRTYHRMAVAIEDAGFEIRDQLAWAYGSGFPKSHDAGDGWGTALKPAWEPIALCRKPLIGTVAANVLKHGTGAINVDGCRIEGEGNKTFERDAGDRSREQYRTGTTVGAAKPTELGRWPANIIHDGSDEVLAGFPNEAGGRDKREGGQGSRPGGFANIGADSGCNEPNGRLYGDEGSAARFFYCAKATTEERGEGNNHPTVKPVSLMRWLCRLVTPKGGTVLDPFMGSGSTALACDAEQFNFIGCELSPEYAAIAETRIRNAAGMFADISIEIAGPNTRAAA